MGWDPVMYAISSDNDNQDNNYTKPGSSITITYHLNNQALKERERGGEEGSWTGSLAVPHISRSRSSLAALINKLSPVSLVYWDRGILR